jgi:predicted amidohydrolase
MKTEVPLRLGVVQMTSTDDLETNLDSVEQLFREATRQSADLVVFPENSLFFRIRSGSALRGVELDGPEILSISRAVDSGKTSLMLTTAMPDGRGRFRNATVLFVPGLPARVVYSKIHLFDVDVPGAPPVRESDFFSGGEHASTVEVGGWKIGLSICYDLRFAELFLNYAQKTDLILVPSAFLVPTGKAHWHTLLRARAIESQCYVAAPAQAGEHRSSDGQARHTFGHSLVVGPWGDVMSDIDAGQEVRVLELLKAPLAKVREQIPMGGHRRLKPFC